MKYFNRKQIAIPFIALLAVAVLAGAALCVNVPRPRGTLVSDFAGIIDSGAEQQIENLLLALNNKTGAQVAVVTMDTVQPETVEQFAVKLFEEWGIGQADEDNGVLILVAVNDRKMRIEVGYGLEGAIPDAAAGNIISQQMTPRFKNGDFTGGVAAGVEAVVLRILDEYNLTPEDLSSGYTMQRRSSGSASEISLGKKIFSTIFTILLIILFIRHPSLFLLLLFSGGGGGRGGGMGGSFGGGFGGFGGGMSGGGGASGGW